MRTVLKNFFKDLWIYRKTIIISWIFLFFLLVIGKSTQSLKSEIGIKYVFVLFLYSGLITILSFIYIKYIVKK